MKKMIATVLTTMMVFGVTACGNTAEDTREVTDETVIEEVEESEDADAEVTEEDAADEADAEFLESLRAKDLKELDEEFAGKKAEIKASLTKSC